MTTATHDVVVVGANGLVRVCAWCTPRVRLEQLHRDHHCTDGLCVPCAEQLEREGA